MKSFDTDIKKYAHKTRLKASERAELRERLVSYMEYHPFPQQYATATAVRSQRFALGAVLSRVASFNTLFTRVAAGALTVLLIVTVPFAAEQATPGDVLYPIKTKFNEPLLSQFNSSPYEKVAFETELMERRIAEARLLAKEGKLTEETEAALAASVAGHATAVQQGIDALKESDAEGAAIAEITFGSTLDVQSAVLGSATVSSPESTDSIATAVRTAKSVADAQRGTTTPSYERLMAHVEQETTRAYELFNAINDAATAEEKEKIERRLADISVKIASAQDAKKNPVAAAPQMEDASTGTMMLMAAKSAPTAATATPTQSSTALLSTTLSDLKKLIVFMTDIDVRTSVTLDTLVPMSPTPAEEAAGHLESLMVRFDVITARITETAVVDAIEAQYDALSERMQAAMIARDAGNTEELQAILGDITMMIASVEEILVAPTVEGAATSTTSTVGTATATPRVATTTAI